MSHYEGTERSLADLLKELRDDTQHLMRRELDLAKAESREKINTTLTQLATIAVGGAIAYGGFLILLGAATYGAFLLLAALDVGIHAIWLAPLIVGVVVGLIGLGFVQKGISALRQENLKPERTTQTLKEDKQWLQSKVSH